MKRPSVPKTSLKSAPKASSRWAFAAAAAAGVAVLGAALWSHAGDGGLTQVATEALLEDRAGMPVRFFGMENQPWNDLGRIRLVAGPGANTSEYADINDVPTRVQFLATTYRDLSWVVENTAGEKTCVIDTIPNQTPASIISRLAAATLCAGNETPAKSTSGYPIWPRAYLGAVDTVRELGMDDAAIEKTLYTPENPYLETYYLDIAGQNRAQHCDAVYKTLDQRSNAVVAAIQDGLMGEKPEDFKNVLSLIMEGRNYESIYLYASAQAMKPYTTIQLDVGPERVMRGYINQLVPLPRCP